MPPVAQLPSRRLHPGTLVIGAERDLGATQLCGAVWDEPGEMCTFICVDTLPLRRFVDDTIDDVDQFVGRVFRHIVRAQGHIDDVIFTVEASLGGPFASDMFYFIKVAISTVSKELGIEMPSIWCHSMVPIAHAAMGGPHHIHGTPFFTQRSLVEYASQAAAFIDGDTFACLENSPESPLLSESGLATVHRAFADYAGPDGVISHDQTLYPACRAVVLVVQCVTRKWERHEGDPTLRRCPVPVGGYHLFLGSSV